MARFHLPGFAWCLAGLALLAITPSPVVAQLPRGGHQPAPVFPGQAWNASPLAGWRAASGPAFQSGEGGSAARTIALHGAVGAGTGLLIGYLLSNASVGDDRGTVILTWTALGAAAGVVSGVVTWLLGRV